MSSNPQTIAIIGSTGTQGASVLHDLLAHPPSPTTQFRAITQSPPISSAPYFPSHPNLTVYQADLLSPPTLHDALSGATIVFATTNSNSPQFSYKPGTEVQAVKNIVDACVEVKTVELLVLSTLPACGEVGAWSFDFKEKSRGMEYAKKVGDEKGLKVVYVELGWYYSNFISLHAPKVNEQDGVVEFSMPGADPNVKGPWVAAFNDLGPAVRGIIENPSPYIGKEIFLLGEWLSLEDISRIYTEVTGQPSRIVHPTPIVNPAEMSQIAGTTEEKEWNYVSAVYNARAYGVGASRHEELLKNTVNRGYVTFAEWLRETGFDAKKEGLGVAKIREKWGGRLYL